ncbi:MAG TPA: hypothetical protein VIM41_12375 [Gammaproteobacteria bacterium]
MSNYEVNCLTRKSRPSLFSLLSCITLSTVSLLTASSAFAASEQEFTLFESGQVRPMAISNNHKNLFVVNTPNNTVEIFNITDDGLSLAASVPVGLEPVAIALRNNNEAWVVNHLSDSVSIIRLQNGNPYVKRTLLVGDEPRDIVFAGADDENTYAFITTAHRGPNAPFNPELTKPGIGRADVWVFDADAEPDSATLGGTPVNIIQLFSDTPRALAVSADGKFVYAAAFKSGNQTTTIWESRVTATAGLPEPTVDAAGEVQPFVGLIVRFNGNNWIDTIGRTWDQYVKFSLPDKDVFVIDATANPPAQVSGSAGYFSGVGTVLFNMAVNPKSGAVYVSNTEAFNENRFEGLGATHQYGTVRGRFLKNRITVIKNNTVAARHLNKHIDFSTCCDPDDNNLSLAQPTDMTVTKDGKTLYVAAFGSAKIGVFDTAQLENDSFLPDENNQIMLSAGGPSGVVLDEQRNRLYVLTRFDNGVSIVDAGQKAEVGHLTMHNPEPASVVAGRQFLYDASYTSTDGNASCGGCHIFGDMDDLAWDLGNPDEVSSAMPGPIDPTGPWRNTPAQINRSHDMPPLFRALKGPMTTQSLRGMANHGPMHWRGDRTGGVLAPSVQPDSGTYNEEIAFKQFNPAFVGLMGRDSPLTDDEMQAFTDFILQVTYPPNPIRALDNSLTPQQQRGKDFFFERQADTFFKCIGCHTTDPDGNREYNVAKPGFFGSSGEYNAGRVGFQVIKVPHLRNLYQKVGMFGMPSVPELLPVIIDGITNPFMGEQVRGFGFFHDGSQDTLFSFHKRRAFLHRAPGTNGPNDPGNEGIDTNMAVGDVTRSEIEAFMLAFPSNLAPIVGQQVTLSQANYQNTDVINRIELLKSRSLAGECELVAHQSNNRGYLYAGNDQYQTNRNGTSISHANLQSAAATTPGEEITFTCVPNGSGFRMALDRNENGVMDGDEPGV